MTKPDSMRRVAMIITIKSVLGGHFLDEVLAKTALVLSLAIIDNAAKQSGLS